MPELPKIIISKTKRRFGIPSRKQWQLSVIAANGEPLDPRDTYFNVADVRNMLELLRGPVELEIHYDSGVRRELLQ